MISLAFDQIKYNTEYSKSHYKTIRVVVPLERAFVLKEIANQTGKSVSQSIIDAIEYYYNVDLHTRNQE